MQILVGSLVLSRKFNATSGMPWTDTSTVLPIKGQVSVGREIGDGVDRMLLSGSVSLHAAIQGWFTNQLMNISRRKSTYVAEVLPLQRGDRVMPIPNDAEIRHRPMKEAAGYVRIPPVGVLQIGYYGPVGRIVVQRGGNATVEAELSIWNRFENEPTLTLIVSLFVFLIASIELWSTAGEIRDRARDSHERHQLKVAGVPPSSPGDVPASNHLLEPKSSKEPSE